MLKFPQLGILNPFKGLPQLIKGHTDTVMRAVLIAASIRLSANGIHINRLRGFSSAQKVSCLVFMLFLSKTK